MAQAYLSIFPEAPSKASTESLNGDLPSVFNLLVKKEALPPSTEATKSSDGAHL